jgi:predicted DNA-binding transcriptional regulator YafY
LVFRSGWWYLAGYCHARTALRTFRVDRIQKLALLSQTFFIPEDFNIHAYLEGEFQEGTVIHARLRFFPKATEIVNSNRTLWESIQENPDGNIEVVLTSPDMTFLASMVMSFGTLVVVLEPQELKDMVREWAQSTAELYKE